MSYCCICLTETWLDGTVLDPELFCNNYIVYRCDRSKLNSLKSRGGGVLISVDKSFSSAAVPLKNSSVEMLCVKISANSQSCYVFNVYLPPDSVIDKYIAFIDNVTSIISEANPSDQFIITGDFNLPEINWTPSNDDELNHLVPCDANSEKAKYFAEAVSMLSMCQVNSTMNHMHRILDLVLTDSPNDIEFQQCDTMLKQDMYHPALSFSINFATISTPEVSSLKRYNFKKCNYDQLNNHLKNIDWSDVLNTTDLNSALENFYKIMLESFEHFVPMVTCSNDKNEYSWFTPELKKMKNRKNNLYKKLKRNFNESTNDEYKKVKAELLVKTRLAYKNHVSSIKESLLIDPKKLWNHIDSKRNLNSLPKVMKLNDDCSDDIVKICDMFATFMESVYKKDNLTVNCNIISDTQCNHTTIIPPVISTSDVQKAIRKAKCSFSPGPDGIPSCILKNCCDSLCNVLCYLFNLSLSSECFPEQWKSSFIIPLFKKGARHDIENYRGIAKLSAIPKTFESIIADDLNFKTKHLVSDMQHGFRSGRSTVTNLLMLTSHITKGFKSSNQTDVGYFDFSKAFDQINHRILIKKLSNYGFTDHYTKWIVQYLSNRVQSVCVNNCVSRSINVVSGVPQGSHLGPLFFVLFINDLPDCIQHSELVLYADDAKVYKTVSSTNDCELLQNDFNNLLLWCNNNDLQVNFKKCNVLSFGRIRSMLEYDYVLGSSNIARVDKFCDLGVIFDSKLTFIDHIDSITSRASSRLGMIKRWTKEFNDPYVAKCLYVSLVRSILEYACPIWNPSYACHVNKIESVQRQFLLFALSTLNWENRLVLPKYEHRLLLIDLNTLCDRRTILGLTFISKILNGLIDCKFLLSNVNIKVPVRFVRDFKLIKIGRNNCNYMKYEPFNYLCENFNEYYSMFDFNLSIDKFKSDAILYFKSKMQN